MSSLRGMGQALAERYSQRYSPVQWVEITQKPLLLPFYHIVSDISPAHARGLYPVRSVDEFKRDLDFFQTHFQSVSMDEILRKKEQFSDPSFHLSFDDGLRESVEVVAPILIERGVHASFFVNTDFIDNKDLLFRFKASLLHQLDPERDALNVRWTERAILDRWADELNISWPDYLSAHTPYLSTQEIKDLHDQGFAVGGHSLNHPRYFLLSLEEQVAQTLGCLDTLAQIIHLPYRLFSFPFTDYGVSHTFFNRVQGSVDLSFGCAGIKDDSALNHLQRLPMEIQGSAEHIVKRAYAYFSLLKKIKRHRIMRN